MKQSKEEKIRKINEGLGDIRPEYIRAAAYPQPAEAPVRNRAGKAALRWVLIAAAAVALVGVLFAGFIFNGYLKEKYGRTTGSGAIPDLQDPAMTGDSSGVTDTVSATDVLPTRPEPNFAEADYRGAAFTVLYGTPSADGPETLFPEEERARAINDAEYRRNRMTEEKYKVKLVGKTDATPAKTLRADVLAATVSYDVVLERPEELLPLMTAGMLGDWNATRANQWDPNAVAGYQVHGKLYLGVNDVSTANFQEAQFLCLMNRQRLEDCGLSNPYELVEKGQWTFDRFTELVRSTADPAQNSFSVVGINPPSLFVGCGVSFLQWDGKDLSFTVPGMAAKMQDITEKTKQAVAGSLEIVKNQISHTLYWELVSESNLVLSPMELYLFQGNLRSVQSMHSLGDACGILPNPKYTADQSRYYHWIDPANVLAWAFPNVSEIDRERLANVMDYWSWASSENVIAELAFRYADTKQDARNLTTVRDTLVYDYSILFGNALSSYLAEGYDAGKFTPEDARLTALEKRVRSLNEQLAALE